MKSAEQNYLLLQEIEANRKFLLLAYQQNPKLLEKSEPRIKQMFESYPAYGWEEFKPAAGMTKQRGTSLIELIMFIVIVSVALAGILLVMNQVTGHSADPLIHKQGLAIAESMLEEIRLQDLSGVTCTGTLGENATRTGVSTVCDYKGYFTTGGIREFSTTNAVVPGLEGYNIRSVTVNNNLGTFGGTPINQGSGVMITVTVADPTGATIEATGYRAGR